MTTDVDLVTGEYPVKRHKDQYSVPEHTLPREATIRTVDFDGEHMHIELTDGRIMSVPLHWIAALGCIHPFWHRMTRPRPDDRGLLPITTLETGCAVLC